MPRQPAFNPLRAWPLWAALILAAGPAQAFFCFGPGSHRGPGFPPPPPPPLWLAPPPAPYLPAPVEEAPVVPIPAVVPDHSDDPRDWQFRPVK